VTRTDRALPSRPLGEARTTPFRLAPPGVSFVRSPQRSAGAFGGGIVRISARWQV